MKKQIKVDTIITRLYCDVCNIEMIKEGLILYSSPERYCYTCPICKEQKILHEIFPRVDYIERKNILRIFNTKKQPRK